MVHLMVVVAGVGRLDGEGNWGCTTGVECLSSMCETLAFTPSIRKKRKEGRRAWKRDLKLGDPCWEAQKEDKVEGGLLRL